MPPSVPFSLPFYREKRSDSGTRETDNWLLLMKCLPRSCFFNRVCFFFFCSQDEVSKNEPRRFRGRTCNARPLYRRDSIMTKTAPGRTWAFPKPLMFTLVSATLEQLLITFHDPSIILDSRPLILLSFQTCCDEKRRRKIALRATLSNKDIYLYIK